MIVKFDKYRSSENKLRPLPLKFDDGKDDEFAIVKHCMTDEVLEHIENSLSKVAVCSRTGECRLTNSPEESAHVELQMSRAIFKMA